MENNTPQKILRWVKSSERLPKYAGSPQNHFRLGGMKVNGNFHYSIDDERCEGEIVFTVIGGGCFQDYVVTKERFPVLEWLEETDAPTETPSLPVEPDACLCVEKAGDHAGCSFPKCSRYTDKQDDSKALPVEEVPEEKEIQREVDNVLKAELWNINFNDPEAQQKAFDRIAKYVSSTTWAWIDSVYEGAAQWEEKYSGSQKELSSLREQLAEARNDLATYQQWLKEEKEKVTSMQDSMRIGNDLIKKQSDEIFGLVKDRDHYKCMLVKAGILA